MSQQELAAWRAARAGTPKSKRPMSQAQARLTVVIFLLIVGGVIWIVAAGGSGNASKSDVAKITPINPDCTASAQLCQSDADLIRNACDGGTDGVGILLDSTKDPATTTLYEQELTALCPQLEGH